MTPADVRDRLTHALRLDLIGPDPGEPQISEILNIAPSRWYLTGFLVPWNAPVSQKQDEEDTQGELELGEAGSGADEDDTTPEPPAARRGHFPSSIGLSVLVSGEAQDLRVTARWGDYTPLEKDEKPTGEWQRVEREETVPVQLSGNRATPSPALVPNSDGLEIITSVRRVRRLESFPGLPEGVVAVSVFLVNRRTADERPELKDARFAFQASLTVDADRPLVPRPNPRGQDAGDDPDERIADLQYRDVMEFAVGHGTATRATIVEGDCRKVATTWMPVAEVERVEPSAMDGVELGMEALAGVADAATLRTRLARFVSDYRDWIGRQRAEAPKGGLQGEVSDDLLQRASLAASRIEAGLALLDDPLVLRAFLLTNRTMAMAARQRRAQEQNIQPAAAEAPEWRPFQLAFLLMNLGAFVSPTHADREVVDLLFFPTGGGKTEAYLGLAAFAILLRRLRDPGLTSAGVTVLMRYTLRLLTLDQLSRASTLICALELVRQETPETLGNWPFEIGLWVGKAATPNRMGEKGEKDKTTARAKTGRYQRGTTKVPPVPLESCPWCGTKLEPTSFRLVPNADEPKNLQLTCRSLSCAFKGKNPLPIVAVDEPLYRRVPCFVIATVDKFASLPWVGPSGALLGGADRHDAIGFYGAADPGIGQKLARPLPPPDLIIQDELHLISGPLGTMAGLYETAVDALCERVVGGHTVRPKIVASTATVRRATEQILALFARSGVEVFPPPGPDRRASFFAETVPLSARRGRLYVGLAAQGRSLKVVLLRSYLALLAAAQKAWLEAGGAKASPNPADPFMTLVGYFNSLRELGGSRRIVEDEVASRVSDYARQRRVNDSQGSFADMPRALFESGFTRSAPGTGFSCTQRARTPRARSEAWSKPQIAWTGTFERPSSSGSCARTILSARSTSPTRCRKSVISTARPAMDASFWLRALASGATISWTERWWCRPSIRTARPSSRMSEVSSGPLADASAGTLRALADALRSGQLGPAITRMALARVAQRPESITTELCRLSAEGLAPTHMALLLEIAADAAEQRLSGGVPVSLVWTGPESAISQSRDTAVVVEELFGHAERFVLVSSYVVQKGTTVFRSLAERMVARPGLHVQLFLHIGREWRDTRDESELLREFAADLVEQWPATRRPEVFYDPRTLSADAAVRAAWHAKCVVADEDLAFVTSANFTEWAQQRNVEAGVLIRDRHFAGQLRQQFDGLVQSKQVRRLPGF